ncbi:hypothetical protein TW83_04530 [Paracoccus sp. S4493]|uniref:hypothetical protein n=1 Tax=Paracoccus sp. S4493 TaxID=579490 RepID=UPI0005FA1905|nr:hypothetical protein [Paracoccus sp. S4493]KJZ32155.1 hypothetical protein TW83_04530 [Paracoccus sp. S4493]
MAIFAPLPVRLPHGPVERDPTDGRTIRVLPMNRHLIPMPEIRFPRHFGQMTMPQIVSAYGHPEYLLQQARIAALIDTAAEIGELTDRDVIMLQDLTDLLAIVIRKASGGIASRWSHKYLLPIFGTFPSFDEVQGRFQVRDGRQEVYDAIGFLHSVSVYLDRLEATLNPVSKALIAGGCDHG